MALIAFVHFDPDRLRLAMDYLAGGDNRVVVIHDSPQTLEVLKQEPPDILVTPMLLRFYSLREVLDALQAAHPAHETRTIVLTTMGANVTPLAPRGEPIRDWSLPVTAFLAPPADPWQIVLSVEQLLHRQVSRS